MTEVIAAIKFVCIFLGIAYAVPVVIGGARGATVSQAQSFLFAFAWSGFITLQWIV